MSDIEFGSLNLILTFIITIFIGEIKVQRCSASRLFLVLFRELMVIIIFIKYFPIKANTKVRVYTKFKKTIKIEILSDNDNNFKKSLSFKPTVFRSNSTQ